MQLTLTGCGDLFGKKIADKPLGNSRLKADCELVMDEFADILDRDISAAIGCLEKNLNIFMNVSELGRGGKLSRTSLLNYLKRNRPETNPKTFAIINSVFSLSNLITGEEKDFISRANVAAIIQLVRTFNFYAHDSYGNTFGSTSSANLAIHEIHRRKVEVGANEIKKALEKIYVADRQGEIHFVKIMDILEGFVANEESLAKIEGVLFVKKIIMGGDLNTINHQELGFLFSHLPKLLSLVLDGVRYKHLELKQPELMTFLKDDVIDLANILFHPARGDRRYEGLFDVDKVIVGIDRFIKDDNKKLSKYRALIKEGVRILTHVKSESAEMEPFSEFEEQWVTGKDLEKVFSHVFNVTSRSLAFHKFYNSPNIRPLLDSPQSIYLDPKMYEIEFPQDKAELVIFARIVNNYRYMHGNFDMAYYSLQFNRNADGVAEIGMFEYLIKTFFSASSFGGSSSQMSNLQLRAILKKFEKDLVELDILLPRRSRSTAETISLLGSLFQAQSDNNGVLDVNEAAEFAVSLVTAMDAKKNLFKFYDGLNCQREQIGDLVRIEPNCFKANFYNSLCHSYRNHLPRLFSYLGADPNASCDQNFNSKHNMDYLDASVKAARTCHIYPDDNSEIYYSESDVMSILLAMMHIETTITRWDKNLNNTMDPNEVIDAWAIYKSAIISMLPKQVAGLPPKIQETLGKLIYQYLVKFEESPKIEGKDLWKTIGNLTKLLIKKAPAHRKNIASILKVVGDESKTKAQREYEADPNSPNVEKPFDCNWMRDPDSIPQD